ncbi:conserved hypothetical protein ['Nostoc azollae' 0708]|uniref:Uncharacterized protein n=1 Tax=Nostoc azollae (strain 0708) TaxID=551115 RepID=D7DWE4_NOSA0|nr:conserved hypothetical protein ['Nostoc azollae' 0708]
MHPYLIGLEIGKGELRRLTELKQKLRVKRGV